MKRKKNNQYTIIQNKQFNPCSILLRTSTSQKKTKKKQKKYHKKTSNITRAIQQII